MANVWFTADLHLGHGNIIKYCHRPFLSKTEQERAAENPRGKWRVSDRTIQRHDDALLDAINAVVQPCDTLWVLGDFCWGDLEMAREYLGRIRCPNVNLVWGKTVQSDRFPRGGHLANNCTIINGHTQVIDSVD